MAEVQEEILQACEAAHMPTVWTSQVLETLTRMDPQSRAEIPDAAMGEWAECVVLNRGPHIIEAIRTLDGILRRMRPHHNKMQPLMRAPNTRTSPQETVEAATLARGARGEKGPRPQALKPARSGRPTRIDAIA
jgi:pyruvate kinase